MESNTAISRSDTHLVVHLVHSFGVGGISTLVADCINRLPRERYRHAVVCLTGNTVHRNKVSRSDTLFFDLHKPSGNDLRTHRQLWTVLRHLKPSIVHTYNVGTIEYNATAMLAGVPVRIHAEHGRDSIEIGGRHARYNLLRRLLVPVIDAYVPVSADLRDWLNHTVGVPKNKIITLMNGVDTVRYAPLNPSELQPAPLWIGTVGRADRIKNHTALLESFDLLIQRFPPPEFDLRLAIVGDGPLLGSLRELVTAKGLENRVWMPGQRDDIAAILQGFSIFVLPSLSEAMPLVLLEAMATGLPVVATRVGGVPDLVIDSETGFLTNPSDPIAFADAVTTYIRDPQMRTSHGAAGQARVEADYSLDSMVAGYDNLYLQLLANKKNARIPRKKISC